jgi:hypothetical protein
MMHAWFYIHSALGLGVEVVGIGVADLGWIGEFVMDRLDVIVIAEVRAAEGLWVP